MRLVLLLRVASRGWPPEGGLQGVASWGWPPGGGLLRVASWGWPPPARPPLQVMSRPCCWWCQPRTLSPACPLLQAMLRPCRWGANHVHPPPACSLLHAMLLLRSQSRTPSSFWSAVAGDVAVEKPTSHTLFLLVSCCFLLNNNVWLCTGWWILIDWPEEPLLVDFLTSILADFLPIISQISYN